MQVAAIPKEHLDELRQMPSPPPAVMQTMHAVHLLLQAGESQPPRTPKLPSATTKLKTAAKKLQAGSKVAPDMPPASPRSPTKAASASAAKASATWQAIRGTLQKNFQARVRGVDPQCIPESACAAVRAALPTGDDALVSVGQASVACAPLFAWAAAAIELAEAMHAGGTVAADVAAMEREAASGAAKRDAAQAEMEAAKYEADGLSTQVEVVRIAVEEVEEERRAYDVVEAPL